MLPFGRFLKKRSLAQEAIRAWSSPRPRGSAQTIRSFSSCRSATRSASTKPPCQLIISLSAPMAAGYIGPGCRCVSSIPIQVSASLHMAWWTPAQTSAPSRPRSRLFSDTTCARDRQRGFRQGMVKPHHFHTQRHSKFFSPARVRWSIGRKTPLSIFSPTFLPCSSALKTSWGNLFYRWTIQAASSPSNIPRPDLCLRVGKIGALSPYLT